MKIFCMILSILLMFSGCGQAPVYETVNDEPVLATQAQPREVYFQLAQEPVMPVMESDGGQLYLCGDYDVAVLTMDAGDLDETVHQVSGFEAEELTVIQTASGDVDKYEFVWTSAAENGQQIGRAAVLDDGNYHYILSATVNADLIEEYQEIWNGIFESFELI